MNTQDKPTYAESLAILKSFIAERVRRRPAGQSKAAAKTEAQMWLICEHNHIHHGGKRYEEIFN